MQLSLAKHGVEACTQDILFHSRRYSFMSSSASPFVDRSSFCVSGECVLTARSPFQVQAAHHLFSTVGERSTARARSGRARASGKSCEGKRVYKNPTPIANTNHHHHHHRVDCLSNVVRHITNCWPRQTCVRVQRPPLHQLSFFIWRSFARRTPV